MKLFRSEQPQKKMLLFVLRDFNPLSDNAEVLKQNILKDVVQIWDEMYKTEETLQASDYFNFEFSFLPHKVFQDGEFNEKCEKLSERFNEEAKDSLFVHAEKQRVPIDGLPIYIEKMWEKIRTQKELNLPDQRILVASLRCNELKEEALEKVIPLIQELKDRSDSQQRVENFAEMCTIIIREAL